MPSRLAILRQRYPGTVRRIRLVALFFGLLAAGAVVAGRVLGPAETDIASELTHVTDAAGEAAVIVAPVDRPIMRVRSGPEACAVAVEAAPALAATVALTVAAPCHGGGRVDVVQGALAVTVQLDAEGRAALSVPALSDAPRIDVLVAEAPPMRLQTWVADFDLYQRAVLQWGGLSGLRLHAFEEEAGWGAAGHVRPDAPRDAGHAISGAGGFLTRLGETDLPDGLGALVYTAPAGLRAALTFEAPVTDATCGREIDAEAFRAGPGQAGAARAVTMTVPGCQAVGDSVLIEGVLADMR